MTSTIGISPAHASKNMAPEEFDVIILGGGRGSTVAAWTFAGEGKWVAVVDRKYHPTLVEGLVPLFSAAPSAHDFANAASRQQSA
jgi:pyruvate/2-oxoglutarate dehydrogenase complex dihydrolipoamide dehydrogenase (E3) component